MWSYSSSRPKFNYKPENEHNMSPLMLQLKFTMIPSILICVWEANHFDPPNTYKSFLQTHPMSLRGTIIFYDSFTYYFLRRKKREVNIGFLSVVLCFCSTFPVYSPLRALYNTCHSYTDGRGCHARCQLLIIQFWDLGVWTSNLPITRRPALPPELQPPPDI